MSYTIDIYRGKTRADAQNFGDFALFVCFFPHLVAGPIMRAHTLLPQVDASAACAARPTFHEGLALVLIGLFKKLVIADNMAPIANAVFVRLRGRQHGRAVGLGGPGRHLRLRVPDLRRLLRLLQHRARHLEVAGLRARHQLPPAVPRASRRATSGGAGTSACRAGCATTCTSRSAATGTGALVEYRNLIITMLLGGLWHGASWTFVAWGLYHGADPRAPTGSPASAMPTGRREPLRWAVAAASSCST